ncbi:MAG: 16S rRNA (cytidine(1402)-2'-O)-methyltransferase, partial [Erysipelotrichaceae bacterium]|nr:16S rRNA (cytidine(1402)-2'-O)-methyltransferase [Erysipelotrichaceae bacterium]
YLVATPIGNLQELTPRAISILKEVDLIAAEDTRNTMKLLSHFDIHTKVIAHHAHNEKQSTEGIIQLLHEGKQIALVSDAGYPLISDPGQTLVPRAIEEGFPVIPVNGSSAMLSALVASGLCAMPFYFHGFLPSKTSAAKKELNELKGFKCTMVFYEAPHRIEDTLKVMQEVLGDRKISLCRELTKRFEEFVRGSISEVLEVVSELKGEMVLVVEGASEESVEEIDVLALVNQLTEEGFSTSAAIKEAAKRTGISKNEIYRQVHASE